MLVVVVVFSDFKLLFIFGFYYYFFACLFMTLNFGSKLASSSLVLINILLSCCSFDNGLLSLILGRGGFYCLVVLKRLEQLPPRGVLDYLALGMY